MSLRPRAGMSGLLLWPVVGMTAGLSAFCVLLALVLLAALSPLALVLAALGAAFGYGAWRCCGLALVHRRVHADFDGTRVRLVRVRAEQRQWPRFEPVAVDLAEVVRIGLGERLEQTAYTIVSQGCAWVETAGGDRTVLAGGREAAAAYARQVAEEVARRTSLVPDADPGFRLIGPFGGAVAGGTAA